MARKKKKSLQRTDKNFNLSGSAQYHMLSYIDHKQTNKQQKQQQHPQSKILRLMCFTPFTGNTCKLQLYFVEIL